MTETICQVAHIVIFLFFPILRSAFLLYDNSISINLTLSSDEAHNVHGIPFFIIYLNSSLQFGAILRTSETLLAIC